MLGLLLDAAILTFIINALQGDGAGDFLACLGVAFGLAIANAALSFLLFPWIGLFVLVPILAADGAILLLVTGMTPRQTLIALGILFGCKLILQVAFSL